MVLSLAAAAQGCVYDGLAQPLDRSSTKVVPAGCAHHPFQGKAQSIRMSHMVHGAKYNVVQQMRNGAELLHPLRYCNKFNG